MDSIRQQIIKAREIRGLSEEELANKVGINIEIIMNIENGMEKPELYLLEKISSVLNYKFEIGNVSI